MQRGNLNRIANLRRLYWDNRRENHMSACRTASSCRRKSCAIQRSGQKLAGQPDKIRAGQDDIDAVSANEAQVPVSFRIH